MSIYDSRIVEESFDHQHSSDSEELSSPDPSGIFEHRINACTDIYLSLKDYVYMHTLPIFNAKSARSHLVHLILD